jgi:antitoxin VapB
MPPMHERMHERYPKFGAQYKIDAGKQRGLSERISSSKSNVYMYMYNAHLNTKETAMAMQIANPTVIEKIDRLAKLTGRNKTAAVEDAVDKMLATLGTETREERYARLLAIVEKIDALPPRHDPFEAIEWDEHGLPK